jgi:hypothetical protein
MTTTGRQAACIVMFLFIALGAIASATRFTASASADEAPTASAARPGQKSPSPAKPSDPKSTGYFSGRVTGPDGKPLRGAHVFVVPYYGELKKLGPVRAQTDADGRFAFDAPDMTYTRIDGLPARREGLVIATKDGYAPDWFHTWGHDHRGLYSHWSPVKGAAVNLKLARDDVPIHGRFLDPAGRPLAGALVRLHTIMIPLEHDLNAHIERDKKLSLMAMGGYQRELYDPQILQLATETRTGPDGRFTLSGIGRNRLAVLKVSAPSVVDTHLTVMTRDGPDVGTRPDFNGKPTQVIHGAGFTLQLKRGLVIKGRVIDRASRKPIAGMWVGPLQNAVNEFSRSLYPGITDENGQFTITGLSPAILEFPNEYNRVIVAAATPGLPYETAWALAAKNEPVVIECRRGIPFRLKLVDEQGRPVVAKVTYVDVQPNADVVHDEVIRPVGWAARRADGTYEGFVLPGPGAVLVETRWSLGYRPAHVDPRAFFAPGRTNWTPEEQISAYGTHDILITSHGRYIGTTYRGPTIDQRDYTAIVLVNPAPNAKPLQLTATVVRDRPRRVSLIDPDGKPVVGAEMRDQIQWPWYSPSTSKWVAGPHMVPTKLRAASFPLTGLHPDRASHITFVKEDHKLIGFLLARGDGDSPYTVRMQPWATVTGRIIEANGKPLKGGIEIQPTGAGPYDFLGDKVDAQGRFHIKRVTPGLSYSVKVFRDVPVIWRFAGIAAEKMVLRPGEVRDLGDIRLKATVK